MLGKKKETERIFSIFTTLLLKLQKHPLHIKEDTVVKIYQRAIEMSKTVDNLEHIYERTGEIDQNIIEGEEIYE